MGILPQRHHLTKKEAEKLGPRLLEEARPLLKEWASELIKYQIIDTFHKMDGVKYSAATAGNRNTWLTNNSDRVLFGKLKSNASSNVMATALATLDTTDDKMTADTVTLGKRIAKRQTRTSRRSSRTRQGGNTLSSSRTRATSGTSRKTPRSLQPTVKLGLVKAPAWTRTRFSRTVISSMTA